MRKRYLQNQILSLVILVVGALSISGQEPETKSTPLTPIEKKQKFAEFQRAYAESSNLWNQGKRPEAIAAYERTIAIVRLVDGPQAFSVADHLAALCKWYLQVDDFIKAAKAAREVLSIRTKLFGEANWRVTDAKLLLADVESQSKMSAEEHQRLHTANALENLQHRAFEQGKFAEAFKPAQQAVDIYKALRGEKHPDFLRSLHLLADLHRQLADHARAITLYSQVVDGLRELLGDKHPDYARTLQNLALVYKEKREYSKAEPLLLQTIEILKATVGERHSDYASTIESLAAIYQDRGDYAKAESYFAQSVAIRKATVGEKHRSYALSLFNLADCHRAQGDYTKADPLVEQALTILEATLGVNHPDLAVILHNQAEHLRQRGEYQRAEPLYLRARDFITAALGDKHPSYAVISSNLASLYRLQGEYARAEPLSKRALEITRATLGEKHPHYATCLHNLARIYMEQGEFGKAEPLLKQSLEITKAVLGDQHLDVATNLDTLATIRSEQGDYARAETYARQALDLRKTKLGDRHEAVASSLNNLAEIYREQKKYALAEPLYQQARAIIKDTLGDQHFRYANNLQNAALLYRAQGENAKAELLLKEAIDLTKASLGAQHARYALSLNNLGTLYGDQGDYDKAEPLLLQAVAIITSILDRTAITQSEASQFTSLATMRRYLDNLLLGTVNRPASATYETILRLRGAITARQAFARSIRNTKPELKPMIAQLQQVAAQLATLVNASPDPRSKIDFAAKMRELTQVYETIERDLAQQSEAFAKFAKRKAPSLGDLRKSLPVDAVLIDFFEFKDQFTAFVIDQTQISRIELGEMKPIAKAVGEFRMTLGRSQPFSGKQDDPASLIMDKIWQPLIKYIDKAKLVLICPDGALCQLPFAALPGRDPKKYLIEEVPLAILPVPQALTELLESPPGVPRESLLIVGGVNFDGDPGRSPDSARITRSGQRGGKSAKWDYLQGAEKEMEAIRKLYSDKTKSDPTILRDNLATEAAFAQAAGKHGYLHLATHGFFSPAEVRSITASQRKHQQYRSETPNIYPIGSHPGLLSGIVFAGANKPPEPGRDDGILTALELGEIDLSGVRLAVLSACETGLGEVAGGEGVRGLQRALQLAGVKTTITTLWKIPDEATQLLMTRFYGNLWLKKMSKIEALRDAQLWMLKEGINNEQVNRSLRGLERVDLPIVEKSGRLPPYFWAAFTLSGDWR